MPQASNWRSYLPFSPSKAQNAFVYDINTPFEAFVAARQAREAAEQAVLRSTASNLPELQQQVLVTRRRERFCLRVLLAESEGQEDAANDST